MGRLFFLFFTHQVFCQHGIVNYQSFVIDNKEVVWAQVYHHEETTEALTKKLFDHLKRKMWITNIGYEGSDIVAELINYRADYQRYGGKFINTSTVLRTGRWTGRVRISFKEEKYRVALYGLNYEATQAASGSGRVTIEQHEIMGTLGEWALNKYRSGFKKKRLTNLDMLHFSFKDSFTLTLDQVIDDDW